MYSLIRPLLFRLDPEKAHDVVMATLSALSRSAMALRAMRARRIAGGPVSFMGLTAANAFGLAAGLDKDARAFPALRALGFGWIEVGTVTPRPQPGNDKPRMFRLEQDRALINRMGFNSCGADRFVGNLLSRRPHYDGVLGVNIGKNAGTSLDAAQEDYVHALEKVYPYADYIAINVSSPNTRSLRDLQHIDRLASLLDRLIDKREQMRGSRGRLVPLAIKLSPDLPEEDLGPLCELLHERSVDGVIAANTTTSRPPELKSPNRDEPGGLSGSPLEPLATRLVAALGEHLRGEIPIIGVGGIEDAATARRKLAAGACAVQCYTSFIYRGPALLNHLRETP